MEQIEGLGVGFRSLKKSIDTTTPAGRMMMRMVGAFAEFERAMIRERTKNGLEKARHQGKRLGRPRSLTEEQKETIRRFAGEGKGASELSRLFEVSRQTIYRVIDRA